MRDLCDVAYVLQVDALERTVLTDRIVVATTAPPGTVLPSVDEARAEFDTWLASVPSPEDAALHEWKQVMGLAR